MSKTLTLKEAKEMCYNYYSNKDEVLGSLEKEIVALKLKNKQIIVSDKYIKESTVYHKCFCHNCNTVYDVEDGYSKQCKKCENTKVINKGGIISNNQSQYYVKILNSNINKEYFSFIMFSINYEHDMNGYKREAQIDESFEWLKGDFKPYINRGYNVPVFGIFIKDKGFRFNKSYQLLNTTAIKHSEYIHEFKKAIILNESEVNIFNNNKSLLNAIEDALNDIKETTKKQKGEYIYDEYIAEDIENDKRIDNAFNKMLIITKEDIGNKKTIYINCPECKATSLIYKTNNDGYEYTCPICGSKHTVYKNFHFVNPHASNRVVVIKYENMKECDSLIVRAIDVVKSINNEGIVTTKKKEVLRAYIDEKKFNIYVYNETERKLIKGSMNDYYNAANYDTVLCQTSEEIIKIINNSVLKYSGLIEAYGLGVNPSLKIEEIGYMGRSNYIKAWHKEPRIEQVIKAGLKNIAISIKNGYTELKKNNHTDICQILGINKLVLKLGRKLNLSLGDIELLQKGWEVDNKINEEIYNELTKISGFAGFTDIVTKYKIPYKRILDYLDSCYLNQCIERNDAFIIWRDYINMAYDMRYDLKNKKVKFPSSLKKEHDKAAFAYKVVINEINRKNFQEKSLNNKKYEYSYKDLVVQIPIEPEALVEEGRNLNHCVASYVNPVREGETIIAFIRKKEEPDISYYTVEIKNDKIIQVKGYSNAKPWEEKVRDFVFRWANAKRLKISCSL